MNDLDYYASAQGIKANISNQCKHSCTLCQDCEERRNITYTVGEIGEKARCEAIRQLGEGAL